MEVHFLALEEDSSVSCLSKSDCTRRATILGFPDTDRLLLREGGGVIDTSLAFDLPEKNPPPLSPESSSSDHTPSSYAVPDLRLNRLGMRGTHAPKADFILLAMEEPYPSSSKSSYRRRAFLDGWGVMPGPFLGRRETPGDCTFLPTGPRRGGGILPRGGV